MPTCGGRSANSWPRRHEEIDFLLYFTPMQPGNMSACIAGIHENEGNLPLLQRPRPPKPPQIRKKTKAPLRPPCKSRRGRKRRRFGLISAGSVRTSRENRRRWDRRSGSHSSRVWVRSILLCPKDVKKKCAVDHKISGQACRVCLQVVVAVREATTSIFAADCV